MARVRTGKAFPVKVFERRGTSRTDGGDDISTPTGDMKEQAAPQLRQRLGRADLRAVPEARRALRKLLRHWGEPGQSEVAELLTSELVTNALVHTEDGAVLTATVRPRALRVEVRDFVGRPPRPRGPQPEEGTNGRGLVLVESLADDWGVRPCTVGKSVWFELGAEAA